MQFFPLCLVFLTFATSVFCSPQYGGYSSGSSAATTTASQTASSSNAINFTSSTGTYAVAAISDGTNVTVALWSPNTTWAGWLGFGIGTGMANADIYVVWFDAKGVAKVSDRTSTGRMAPAVDTVQRVALTKLPTSLASYVPAAVQSSTGRLIVFTRPLTGTSPDKTLNGTGTNALMWAYGLNKPVNGTITKHAEKGTFTLALTASSATTAAATATTTSSGGAAARPFTYAMAAVMFVMVAFIL